MPSLLFTTSELCRVSNAVKTVGKCPLPNPLSLLSLSAWLKATVLLLERQVGQIIDAARPQEPAAAS